MHRVAVHGGRLFELVGSEGLVHVPEGYFRENHVASICLLLLPKALESGFGKAVGEVNAFTEHVAGLGGVRRWHSEPVHENACDAFSFGPVPQQEFVVHLLFKWIKSEVFCR